MSGHLYVTWAEYHQAIERLAAKIHHSGYRFDQIICLARGGMGVGDTLSRIFNQPLGVLATQSYFSNGKGLGDYQGELSIGQHLAKVNERLGDHILLVDDLVDSGVTMQKVVHHLRERYPAVQSLKTAVIWKKGASAYQPDYFAVDLPDSPWIHQPHDVYDQMKPESLPKP